MRNDNWSRSDAPRSAEDASLDIALLSMDSASTEETVAEKLQLSL